MPTPLRHIDPAYRHQPKLLTPGPLLQLSETRLKWYSLAPAAEPVEPEVERLAREFLAARPASADRELGFAILHRCGAGFYFLLLSTWRGSNELWESVFYKESAAMPQFALFPLGGDHRATFCVWELAAVWHEQQAWVRFLSSARTAQDEERYLGDTLRGPV